MKKKILVFVIALTAFLAGSTFVYIGTNKNTVKNGSESGSYNSCSNCMSGTMVVNNVGISQSVKKIYDSVVMVKNYKNTTLRKLLIEEIKLSKSALLRFLSISCLEVKA